MKPITKPLFFVFILLAIALAFPGNALAANPDESLPVKVVLGANYTLDSGETLRANLWVVGGNVTLETESLVTGDVLLLGGNLKANGEIRGNIDILGGNVELSDEAIVGGDINQLGGSLDEHNAIIKGSINTPDRTPFNFWAPSGVRFPMFSMNINPFWGIVSLLFRAFLLSALAMLVVMIWPKHIVRIGQSVVAQPLIVGVVGLATAVVAGFVLLILLITICLSPFALLGGLFMLFLLLFGWASLGLEIGQRIAQMFHKEWAPPLAAGIGTFFLSLIASGMDSWFFLSCVSWVLGVIAASLAIGGVLMTRFGTQSYPGVVPPPAPAEPVAPVGPEGSGGGASALSQVPPVVEPPAPETSDTSANEVSSEAPLPPSPHKGRKPKETTE